MKMIELHLLQSFPFTCLNRDAYGSPKTAFFGGVPRARVSSQCWKRAVRDYAFELSSDYFQGKRGRWHTIPLSEKLEELGLDPLTAKKYALETLNSLCKKSKEGSSKNDEATEGTDKKKGKKKEGRTSSSLDLIPVEIDAIAKTIIEELNCSQENAEVSGKNKKKTNKIDKDKVAKAVKEAERLGFGDIALFGRMVAGTPTLNIEGAALFSHALSTHKVMNEIDYFSAVDDTMPSEETGAGHIGELEANSACYYRYVGLNLDLLFGKTSHLKELEFEDKQNVLKFFLEAVMKAVPKAHRNSMFGNSLPQYAKALVRSGQPLSLVNAFEIPIQAKRDGGYIAPSRQELEKHFADLNSIYGVYKDAKEYELNVENPFDKWIEEIVGAALEEYK